MNTHILDELNALQHPTWQWDDDYDNTSDWRMWLGYQPPSRPVQFLLLADDDEQATRNSIREQAAAQNVETDEVFEEIFWRQVTYAHDNIPLNKFGVISVCSGPSLTEQDPVEATVCVLRGAHDKLVTRNPWLTTFALASAFHHATINADV